MRRCLLVKNDNFSDLKYLTKEDNFATILMLLFTLTKNPKYSTLSELVYILDAESFTKFITYYAGQTIKVPKMEDIIKAFRTMLLYQFYVVEKNSWADSLKMSGFSKEDSYKAQHLLTSLKKSLNYYGVGNNNLDE